MTTQLYFIRHGESVGNLNHAFLGHTDLPLTELGRRQAEKASDYLKILSPDVIYASDLKRAYETALPTAKKTNLPIIKKENLREIYAGEWENADFDKLPLIDPENFSAWLNSFHEARPRGGESVAELMERIKKAVLTIAEENPEKTIFIFTHATPVRLFAAFCEGKKKEDWNLVPWAPNTSTTHVKYENGTFTLLEYGKADYLGNLVTSFDKKENE